MSWWRASLAWLVIDTPFDEAPSPVSAGFSLHDDSEIRPGGHESPVLSPAFPRHPRLCPDTVA